MKFYNILKKKEFAQLHIRKTWKTFFFFFLIKQQTNESSFITRDQLISDLYYSNAGDRWLPEERVRLWCTVCLWVIKVHISLWSKNTAHREDNTRTLCQGKAIFGRHQFWCFLPVFWPVALSVCGFVLVSKTEWGDYLWTQTFQRGLLDGWLCLKLINPISLKNDLKKLLRNTVAPRLTMIDSKDFICLFFWAFTPGAYFIVRLTVVQHINQKHHPQRWQESTNFGLPLTVNKAAESLSAVTAHFGASSSKPNCPKSNKSPPFGVDARFEKPLLSLQQTRFRP